MNNNSLRLLSVAIMVSAFIASSVVIQFQKNREFRQRINALEAQVREINLRLDLHELPFSRPLPTAILQLDPPVIP